MAKYSSVDIKTPSHITIIGISLFSMYIKVHVPENNEKYEVGQGISKLQHMPVWKQVSKSPKAGLANAEEQSTEYYDCAVPLCCGFF